MQNPHMTRAQMLLSQSRPEMAEAELRRGLEAEPENANMHALLGFSLIKQHKTDASKQALREAIRLDPMSFFPHYLMGMIHLEENKLIDARRAVDEALRLDPYQPCNYGLVAMLHYKQGEREQAIQALDRGLSMDPEDVDCLNLRAQILTQMGRSAEAAGTIKRTMRAAPENADAHATQGWAYLHTNKPKEALKHFDEALRIEPGHDYARAGLVEALKARFLIYRLVLGFFLWTARMDGRARMTLLVGAYIGYQVVRAVARASEELRPVAYVLIGLYLGFVLLTWITIPLFNLMLRLNTHGWHALDKEDKIATDGFGILLLIGLILGGLGYWLHSTPLYFWAAYTGIMAIVLYRIISELAWKKMPVMFYAGITAAFTGLITVTCISLEGEEGLPLILDLLFLLSMLTFWIALIVFMFSSHFRRQ